MYRNTILAYGSVAKFFHWLIAVLVIAMLVYGYFLEDIPKDYQPFTYNLHKMTGLTILVLIILRGLWALTNVKPMLPPDVPNWQRWIEQLVHFILYAALIAMPLSGWIGSSSSGRPPHLGDMKFNLPIAKDEALIDLSFNVHNTLAIIIIVLVSLHVLAAFYHLIIKRDEIFQRMWPKW